MLQALDLMAPPAGFDPAVNVLPVALPREVADLALLVAPSIATHRKQRVSTAL